MNKSFYYTPLLAVALAGCDMSAEKKIEREMSSKGFEMKSDAIQFGITVWTDPDTQRQYIIVRTGNGVAITPRLPKE